MSSSSYGEWYDTTSPLLADVEVSIFKSFIKSLRATAATNESQKKNTSSTSNILSSNSLLDDYILSNDDDLLLSLSSSTSSTTSMSPSSSPMSPTRRKNKKQQHQSDLYIFAERVAKLAAVNDIIYDIEDPHYCCLDDNRNNNNNTTKEGGIINNNIEEKEDCSDYNTNNNNNDDDSTAVLVGGLGMAIDTSRVPIIREHLHDIFRLAMRVFLGGKGRHRRRDFCAILTNGNHSNSSNSNSNSSTSRRRYTVGGGAGGSIGGGGGGSNDGDGMGATSGGSSQSSFMSCNSTDYNDGESQQSRSLRGDILDIAIPIAAQSISTSTTNDDVTLNHDSSSSSMISSSIHDNFSVPGEIWYRRRYASLIDNLTGGYKDGDGYSFSGFSFRRLESIFDDLYVRRRNRSTNNNLQRSQQDGGGGRHRGNATTNTNATNATNNTNGKKDNSKKRLPRTRMIHNVGRGTLHVPSIVHLEEIVQDLRNKFQGRGNNFDMSSRTFPDYDIDDDDYCYLRDSEDNNNNSFDNARTGSSSSANKGGEGSTNNNHNQNNGPPGNGENESLGNSSTETGYVHNNNRSVTSILQTFGMMKPLDRNELFGFRVYPYRLRRYGADEGLGQESDSCKTKSLQRLLHRGHHYHYGINFFLGYPETYHSPRGCSVVCGYELRIAVGGSGRRGGAIDGAPDAIDVAPARLQQSRRWKESILRSIPALRFKNDLVAAAEARAMVSRAEGGEGGAVSAKVDSLVDYVGIIVELQAYRNRIPIVSSIPSSSTSLNSGNTSSNMKQDVRMNLRYRPIKSLSLYVGEEGSDTRSTRGIGIGSRKKGRTLNCFDNSGSEGGVTNGILCLNNHRITAWSHNSPNESIGDYKVKASKEIEHDVNWLEKGKGTVAILWESKLPGVDNVIGSPSFQVKDCIVHAELIMSKGIEQQRKGEGQVQGGRRGGDDKNDGSKRMGYLSFSLIAKVSQNVLCLDGEYSREFESQRDPRREAWVEVATRSIGMGASDKVELNHWACKDNSNTNADTMSSTKISLRLVDNSFNLGECEEGTVLPPNSVGIALVACLRDRRQDGVLKPPSVKGGGFSSSGLFRRKKSCSADLIKYIGHEIILT